MKLTIDKSTFLNALSHGQSVVEKKTTVPILSHVLLSANNVGLSLTTTDMDIALIETIPAQVQVKGSTTVSAGLLYEIVRKLSDKQPVELTLNEEQTQLQINSGRSKFQLGCLHPDDFPQITQSELTHQFSIPSTLLRHLIDSTRFSMSTEETRYHLNGIHFHTMETENGLLLRAVATDLHRLACVECSAPDDARNIPEVIVGRKTIHEISKLISEVEQTVNIGLSQNRIELSYNTDRSRGVLTSRLIDGAFPDYQSAMNVPNDKRLVVETKSFNAAVDRVGTIISDKVRAIKLSLSNNLAILSAVGNDTESATEELDVDYPYPTPIEICFNVKYLTDVAQQIQNSEMEFMLADSDSSVLVRPNGNSHETYILMPMRV